MTENPDVAGQASGDGQRRESTARLTVTEMDCPSCVRKVDESLQRVGGIVDATPQRTTGTATVTYDSDRATEAERVGVDGYQPNCCRTRRSTPWRRYRRSTVR